jgi:hypothetical protein
VDLQKTLYTASTWVLPVLIAINFHEAAHAYAAETTLLTGKAASPSIH